MSEDPEERRRDDLIRRTRAGEAESHEHEELALYVGEDERDRLADEGTRARTLGGKWLARNEADERIQAIDKNPRQRLVRSVGLTLLGAGVLLSVFAPVTGVAVTFAGTGLLLANLVRCRIAAHRNDPYRNVER